MEKENAVLVYIYQHNNDRNRETLPNVKNIAMNLNFNEGLVQYIIQQYSNLGWIGGSGKYYTVAMKDKYFQNWPPEFQNKPIQYKAYLDSKGM